MRIVITKKHICTAIARASQACCTHGCNVVLIAIVFSSVRSIQAQDKETEYAAFSLKVAQTRIADSGNDWREVQPELYYLGGLNEIVGFVYDDEAKDLILLGRRTPGRATLTLDDLVVALRARFVYREWPMVSIDPTSDQATTKRQRVRFGGGIENTAFGASMLKADYLVKEISFGHVSPGIDGIRVPWHQRIREADEIGNAGGSRIRSRFWFYPTTPHIVVRDGVCAIRGLGVSLFTEVLAATIDGKPIDNVDAIDNPINRDFVEDISSRFEELCQVHESFNRLLGLQQLVGVSKALEELGVPQSLQWWLESFDVQRTETPLTTQLLEKNYSGRFSSFEISGGVQLTALAIRAQAGDLRAIREILLRARSAADTLSWSCILSEESFKSRGGEAGAERLSALRTHAEFLMQHNRFAFALNVIEDIQVAHPGVLGVSKAYCALRLDRPDEAIAELDQLAATSATDAVLETRALAWLYKALKTHPRYDVAWGNGSLLLSDLGTPLSLGQNIDEARTYCSEALDCCNETLSSNPYSLRAWIIQGLALVVLRRTDELQEWLDSDPLVKTGADTWMQLAAKATALELMDRPTEALEYCEGALRASPTESSMWFARGVLLAGAARRSEAEASLRRAGQLGSPHAMETMRRLLQRQEFKIAAPNLEHISCQLAQQDNERIAEQGNTLLIVEVTFDFPMRRGIQATSIDTGRLFHLAFPNAMTAGAHTWDVSEDRWHEPGLHFPALNEDRNHIRLLFEIPDSGLDGACLVYRQQALELSCAR